MRYSQVNFTNRFFIFSDFSWVLALALAAGALSGRNERSGKPIKIVLPNDFLGEFEIVKDEDGDLPELQSGFFLYSIPDSGVAKYRDIRPFFDFHQVRIEYADGRVIVDYSQDKMVGAGVTVESLGVTAGKRKVGTSSWQGSTDYDGTTLQWKVSEAR